MHKMAGIWLQSAFLRKKLEKNAFFEIKQTCFPAPQYCGMFPQPCRTPL